jgi:hypothetical protein
VAEISVQILIAAKIEEVFAAVSDHETFISGSDGTRTTVIRPGTPDRNGLGSLREVHVPYGIRFVEEVTAWSPPATYEYLIRETSLPMRHHGGRVALRQDGSNVAVDWSTRFDITVPLLGHLFDFPACFMLRRAFERMLADAKKRLESARVAV